MKSYQNQSKHTEWDFAVTQSSLSKSFLRTQFIFLYSLILQSKSKDKILINIQLKRNSKEISNLRCTILSFSTFAWFFVYNQGDSTLFLKCYTKSLKSCLWTAIQYIMLTSPLFTFTLFHMGSGITLLHEGAFMAQIQLRNGLKWPKICFYMKIQVFSFP